VKKGKMLNGERDPSGRLGKKKYKEPWSRPKKTLRSGMRYEGGHWDCGAVSSMENS